MVLLRQESVSRLYPTCIAHVPLRTLCVERRFVSRGTWRSKLFAVLGVYSKSRPLYVCNIWLSGMFDEPMANRSWRSNANVGLAGENPAYLSVPAL